jgi:hypothetical protein
MTEDNVVDLGSYKRQMMSEKSSDRGIELHAERNKEADELLELLRRSKRIAKRDQPVLVSNLGRLVARLDQKNPLSIAEKILQDNEWQKRKRYILFPNEVSDALPRYAASGGTFARLIDRLIEETASLRSISRVQSKIEIVYQTLKGTSFRRPSRFQMTNGEDDAAFFIKSLERVLDSFAEEVDLSQYFELVSKYPLYPAEPSTRSQLLELEIERQKPNNLYEWDDFWDEDDLENWIPWWAPKCVIGHLYIPFLCSRLRLSERGVAEITTNCDGEITQESWRRGECSFLVEPFVDAQRMDPASVTNRSNVVNHRLPIWLIVLPTRNKLVACLYASIHYREEFQINQSLSASGNYYLHDDKTTPCFVDLIGEEIEHDVKFFCGDHEDDHPYYVRYSETSVEVIGSAVDEDLDNFKAEVLDPYSTDEIPLWLHSHPVQRLLKLTMESDAAKVFALSPQMSFREFANRATAWPLSVSIFRPAFSDPVADCTPPLRQNTIAAYLLRNFVNAGNSTIFEALKSDTLAKAAAAREVIGERISKFQDAFEKRYGK